MTVYRIAFYLPTRRRGQRENRVELGWFPDGLDIWLRVQRHRARYPHLRAEMDSAVEYRPTNRGSDAGAMVYTKIRRNVQWKQTEAA